MSARAPYAQYFFPMSPRAKAVGFYSEKGKTRPITVKQKPTKKRVVAKPKRFQVQPKSGIRQVAKIEQAFLKRHASRMDLAGSFRRKVPEPNDIDFVVIPKSRKDKEAIYRHAEENKIRVKGEQLVSYWRNGRQIDVYFAEPSYYGAMLMSATGPAGANIGLRVKAKKQGLKLNQYGVFDSKGKLLAAKTEKAIFKELHHPWKPPEKR